MAIFAGHGVTVRSTMLVTERNISMKNWKEMIL